MLCAVGGAFLVGKSAGVAETEAAGLKVTLKLERAGRAADLAALQASLQVGQALAARTAEIRTVHPQIRLEVPRLVTPETDARYPLPVGFVRLHDASAAGVPPARVPDPAGRADDAASGIAASEAATVIDLNYEACRDHAARLIGWQSWWRGQSAAAGLAPD